MSTAIQTSDEEKWSEITSQLFMCILFIQLFQINLFITFFGYEEGFEANFN